MGTPTWRWGAVAALLALLVALPSLAGVLPADAGSPPGLLGRVQGSQDVAWSGLGESTGLLAVPDVRELSDLPGLLGGTTRARGWWRGPEAYRVDVVTPLGESDVVVDGAGAWLWESTARRATRLQGEPPVRLPRGADLLAPLLGRRLARTPGLVATPLPGRRVAGRPAAGLRLTAPPGTPTTVARIDLWAEPRTGLPLRVEATAVGGDRPVVVSELLDLALEEPALVRVAFGPPPGAELLVVDADDLVARADRSSTALLPSALAGQARNDALPGAVAGYGSGLGAFVVVPLRGDLGRSVLRRVRDQPGAVVPPDDDARADVRTPLLNAAVVRAGRRTYLVAGTVPVAVVDSAVAGLRALREPRR